MPGKRPTIDDIARLAGVSKATVSRVLNRKPDVDPITRDRILRLVEEQGFVKSAAAVGLAGGRNHLIGMMARSYTWLYVLEIMRAVVDYIDDTTYELLLYRINDHYPEQDPAQTFNRFLTMKLASGVLAIFPGEASSRLVPLSEQAIPLVVIDDEYMLTETPWAGPPIPWLVSDNHTGAYEAVRHLISHGHRRIAHVRGNASHLCAHERYAGYCQALEEAGIALDPSLVIEGKFTVASGRAAGDQLFSLPPEQRPTAIFAASDWIAYGVLASAEAHGVRIPQDMALIGFDDVVAMTENLADLPQAYAPLTTIRQPWYEMGRYAIELVRTILEMPQTYESQKNGTISNLSLVSPVMGNAEEFCGVSRLLLPTTLIVRETCGCHPSQSNATLG